MNEVNGRKAERERWSGKARSARGRINNENNGKEVVSKE